MTGLLLAILSNKFVIGAGAALFAIVAAFWKGRASGAAKERQKTAQERLKAREDMDGIQNDVGSLPPSEARKELSEWSK